MSLDQGQRAEFRFNKTNFAKISKKIRENINAYHQYCFDVAIVIYNELKTNKVKKEHKIAYDFIIDKMRTKQLVRYVGYQTVLCGSGLTGYNQITNDFRMTLTDDIIYTALNEIFRNNNKTLLKPRRSAYPHIKNTQKSFGVDFECGEVSIGVNANTLTVSWEIQMNNHAVDNKEDMFYGRLLFPIIRAHKWGRKETGTLINKIESTDDSYDADRYIYDYTYYGEAEKNQGTAYMR